MSLNIYSAFKHFKQQHGRNVGLTFLGQIAPLAAALISMPYLVKLLGTDRIGLLSLIMITVGYFTLLDFGLGRAVTKVIAEAIVRGERNRVATIFWSAARFQILMGVAGAVLLSISVPFLVTGLLHVPQDLENEAKLSLFLSAVSLPVVLFSSSVVGLLQAAHRFDLTVSVQGPSSVVNYLLPVAGAMLWPSLPPVVILLVMTRFVSSAILFRFALNLFPDLRQYRSFDRKEFFGVFRFGGWLSISSVTSPILAYLDRFVIAGLQAVSEVAYYSVPADAVGRMLIFPSSVATVMFPAFSGKASGSARLFYQSTLIVLVVLGVLTGGIVWFGSDLMRLWMGQEFALHSGPALRILAIGVLVNGLAFMPSTFLQASGRPDLTAKLHLIELPINVLLVYFCVKAYGIVGAAIAWDIRVTLDALLLFVLARRLIGSTKTASVAEIA